MQLTVFGLLCAYPITFIVTSIVDSGPSDRDKALEVCIEADYLLINWTKKTSVLDSINYHYNPENKYQVSVREVII